MFFSQGLVLAATLASALAAPVAESFKPWELTESNTFSPSGRPGSSPYDTFFATIVDSNSYLPSSANCSTKWTGYAPYNKAFSCQSNNAKAKWTFEFTTKNSSTESYDVAYTLVQTKGSTVKKFTGGDHFEVGTNLGGECGGSGVCSWNLKSSPYAILQKQK